MKIIPYDKMELKDGIWQILRKTVSKKKRDKICEEIKLTYKYTPQELFEQLNRTQTRHQSKITKEQYESLISKHGDNLPEPLVKYLIKGKCYFYKVSKETPKGRALYREYLRWANFLYHNYRIPIQVFDLDNSFDAPFKPQNFTILDLKRVTSEKPSDIDIIFNNYEQIIDEPLQEQTKRIYVNEYLEQFKAKHDKLKKFYTILDAVYKKIEAFIKGKTDVEYVRVISLPLRRELPINTPRDHLLAIVIREISTELFAHICRCIYHDIIPKNQTEKYLSASNKTIRSGFYLANKPIRTYQYAVIDNNVVSEYYRYNVWGECFPDHVFMEEQHPDSEHLYISTESFRSYFKSDTSQRGKKVADIDKLYSLNTIDQIKRALDLLNNPQLGLSTSDHEDLLKEKVNKLNEITKGR